MFNITMKSDALPPFLFFYALLTVREEAEEGYVHHYTMCSSVRAMLGTCTVTTNFKSLVDSCTLALLPHLPCFQLWITYSVL